MNQANDVIGHSRLLQQNRHKAEVCISTNVRFAPIVLKNSPVQAEGVH